MSRWRAGRPHGPLSMAGLAGVIGVVALDQVAKLIAVATLPPGAMIEILPILTLQRVQNTGLAFSMFAGSGAALIALTFVVTAIVIAFWLNTHEGGHLATAGFALILGGALGNIIDRLRLGYVTDFLLLHVGGLMLFVFNLADAALTVGPLLLLITYLWPAVAKE